MAGLKQLIAAKAIIKDGAGRVLVLQQSHEVAVSNAHDLTRALDNDETAGFAWVSKADIESIDIVEPARSVVAGQLS